MGIQGLHEQVLANVDAAMLCVNIDNFDRVVRHKLIIRTESKSCEPTKRGKKTKYGKVSKHGKVTKHVKKRYRALVIAYDILRMEGPKAKSPKRALEKLLEKTAEVIEDGADIYESGDFDGEMVIERTKGFRIAVPERDV